EPQWQADISGAGKFEPRGYQSLAAGLREDADGNVAFHAAPDADLGVLRRKFETIARGPEHVIPNLREVVMHHYADVAAGGFNRHQRRRGRKLSLRSEVQVNGLSHPQCRRT